jgi:hypothetical protein
MLFPAMRILVHQVWDWASAAVAKRGAKAIFMAQVGSIRRQALAVDQPLGPASGQNGDRWRGDFGHNHKPAPPSWPATKRHTRRWASF